MCITIILLFCFRTLCVDGDEVLYMFLGSFTEDYKQSELNLNNLHQTYVYAISKLVTMTCALIIVSRAHFDNTFNVCIFYL